MLYKKFSDLPPEQINILLISSAVAMHSQTNTHSLTAVVTASGGEMLQENKIESHGMCYKIFIGSIKST